MRIVVMGNAGAGKTTLARALTDLHPAPRLSLDEVAFSEGTERRGVSESLNEIRALLDKHPHCIIEGCYSTLIEPLLPSCDVLVFLNPGVETCVAHCRRRPWEKEKFDSPELQEANLDGLISWVREYEWRVDEYGLLEHRRLFDSFRGRKFEFASVGPETAELILSQTAS